MASWVKFWTIEGVEVSYHPDQLVKTLRGAQVPARDATDHDTVLVEVWNPRTGKHRVFQAMRDAANWKAALAKVDGEGVVGPEAPLLGAVPAEAAPTEVRRGATQRGRCGLSVGATTVTLQFASWIKASVRNAHRDTVAALFDLDHAAVRVRVEGASVYATFPDRARCEAAARAAFAHLAGVGFQVTRTGLDALD